MRKRLFLLFLCCMIAVMNFSVVVTAQENDNDMVSNDLLVPKIYKVTKKGKEKTSIQWGKIGGVTGYQIVKGMKSGGVKIWKKGSMALDLTQTSYSTIASVDLEVGDRKTSTSDKNLSKIAKGIFKGIENYY